MSLWPDFPRDRQMKCDSLSSTDPSKWGNLTSQNLDDDNKDDYRFNNLQVLSMELPEAASIFYSTHFSYQVL